MQKIEFNACGPSARLSGTAILDLVLVHLAALGSWAVGLTIFSKRYARSRSVMSSTAPRRPRRNDRLVPAAGVAPWPRDRRRR